MRLTPIRRKRRPLSAAALFIAVLTVGGFTPRSFAQTPTQPIPATQPVQQPVPKGRSRTSGGQPVSQPPKAEESKGVPDAAGEKPAEAEGAQLQTPPQPA